MIDHEESFHLFIYTPLCGTCKLARRMLDVIEQTDPKLRLYEVNITEISELIVRWQVSSVPCLLSYSDGGEVRKRYAFHSIPDLMDDLRNQGRGA